MAEDHVINRIEKLEKTSENMGDNLQKLGIQTARIAASLEILTESMARQRDQNKKIEDLSHHIATIEERMMRQYEDYKIINQLPSRITSLESSMSLVNKVGGTILTVAVGMVMVFLFQTGVPLIK